MHERRRMRKNSLSEDSRRISCFFTARSKSRLERKVVCRPLRSHLVTIIYRFFLVDATIASRSKARKDEYRGETARNPRRRCDRDLVNYYPFHRDQNRRATHVVVVVSGRTKRDSPDRNTWCTSRGLARPPARFRMRHTTRNASARCPPSGIAGGPDGKRSVASVTADCLRDSRRNYVGFLLLRARRSTTLFTRLIGPFRRTTGDI